MSVPFITPCHQLEVDDRLLRERGIAICQTDGCWRAYNAITGAELLADNLAVLLFGPDEAVQHLFHCACRTNGREVTLDEVVERYHDWVEHQEKVASF